MENFSSLQQNVDALVLGVLDLKHIKNQVETREDRDMDGWLEKVEGREREIDEIRKEFEILRRDSYNYVTNLKAIEMLSQKVIGNLKDVKLLSDEGNANSKSIPTHSNKLKPKQFSQVDLSNYTSASCKSVASGAFSKVYRGKLDGMQVAIKVLNNDKVAAESFTVEVETLFTASHPNLVKLYGYCFELNMKALVYEYMENGSFNKILFENHLNLEWGKLYGIVLEIAKGLAYLHEGCGKNIIHRDMKPANVLIDKNLSAKITDFGEAKLLSMDEKDYTITNNRGTDGYIAPEFRYPISKITNKCDVYSFGVTLFEVLSKKRNNGRGKDWFPFQVWTKFNTGKLDEIIDSFGIPETHKSKAKILSMVAFWCTQCTVEIRPSMSTVVEVLEKEISVLNTPPDPFKEHSPPHDITMVPSQEVIHSESLAFEEEENKDEAEKNSDEESKTSSETQIQSKSSETEKLLSGLMTGRPLRFSRSDIERFTSDFSVQIGSGRYGDVYKGQLLDGVKVAIKVLKDGKFRDEIFMNSVRIMGPVYHPNIVKLHGYCHDANLQALIYEYVENGSLDKILYMNHFSNMEWEQLHEIVIETAKGLSALHSVGIIHHDIKASNILLNSNFSPKIDCSGLERLIEEVSDTHVTQFRGTSGYTAPEKWMLTSVVTSKSDVYSYGMLLFEVLGRRRNGIGQEWFPIQVWKMYTEKHLSKIIEDCGINKKDRDRNTSYEWKLTEAYNLAKVAFWCAQPLPRQRPSMSSVVDMLQIEIPVRDPPNPFVFGGPSTSSSPEGSPRFNREASPTIELSFLEKRSLEERCYDDYSLNEDDYYSNEGRDLESMLNSFEEKCPPGGENSVVLYTRTVRFLGRFSKCNNVRSILKSHQIEIFERDISANSAYRVELKELLGRTEVPALFVHGRFIGGVKEVKRLETKGKLKILLHAIPVFFLVKHPIPV